MTSEKDPLPAQTCLKPGGLTEVLRISIPLILSAAGHAVNLFTDRVMLSWYGADAVSAVLPAGLTAFAASSIFFGTAGYANAFVSQYVGAGRPERVGPSVWQGIIFALLGGAFMATGWFWAGPLFKLFGHPAEIQEGEVTYFSIMALGTVIMLLSMSISAFWSGRGRTKVIMMVNLLVTILNVVFNYGLIFGNYGLPSYGIQGAAMGTLSAEAVGLLIYIFLFLRPSMRKAFNTWPERLFDRALFGRLVRYGMPSGIQLFLDMAAFNTFVVILGRYGKTVQEASSIVFSLNAISFIPMIGLGQTVSILVGQSIGAKDIPKAKRSVRSGIILTLIFMGVMATLFVVCPNLFLQLFVRPGDPGQAETLALARQILFFVAAYTLFDGAFIIYGSAIKGAGDTAFAMWVGSAMAWFCYALPCSIACAFGASMWVLWSILVAYVVIESLVFLLRYNHGAWERMSVIERRDPEAPPPDNSPMPSLAEDIE